MDASRRTLPSRPLRTSDSQQPAPSSGRGNRTVSVPPTSRIRGLCSRRCAHRRWWASGRIRQNAMWFPGVTHFSPASCSLPKRSIISPFSRLARAKPHRQESGTTRIDCRSPRRASRSMPQCASCYRRCRKWIGTEPPPIELNRLPGRGHCSADQRGVSFLFHRLCRVVGIFGAG